MKLKKKKGVIINISERSFLEGKWTGRKIHNTFQSLEYRTHKPCLTAASWTQDRFGTAMKTLVPQEPTLLLYHFFHPCFFKMDTSPSHSISVLLRLWGLGKETPFSGSPGRQDVLLAALQVQVWNTSVVWLKPDQEQPLPWNWLYYPQQKRLHWNENLGYSSLSSSIPLSLGLSETPLECQELPLGTQRLTSPSSW